MFVSRTLMLALLVGFSFNALAQTAGQRDDFEGGTTEDWRIGQASNVTPIHSTGCGTGSPAGGCMQATAGPGAPPKLAVINTAQWAGNFTGGDITGVRMQVRNTGATTVMLRLGYATGDFARPDGASEDVVTIAPGPDYVEANFSLLPDDTLPIGGADPETTLANVVKLFIAHYPDEPTGIWQPPDITATIDIDDIELLGNGGMDLIFADGFEATVPE